MQETDLKELINQAIYLPERLAGRWIVDDSPANLNAAQTRLERWCRTAAGGDWTRFARRLAWLGLSLSKLGLDVESALPLLGDGFLAERAKMPEWADFLVEVFVQTGDAADPASFIHPFATIAQARLERKAGAALPWLTPQAQESLRHFLEEKLLALAQPTLDYESERRSRTSQTGLSRLLAEIGAGEERDDAPVASLREICHAYPVLARQLSTAAIQWVDGIAEFLHRLAADWPALCAFTGYSPSLAPGSVADLRPGFSDPHRGGRTVWRVTLANGAALAYKPKDLAMDRAWNDLLVWCNEQGLSPRLGYLWTLPRAGYGWMAWAEGSGALSAKPQQMGMLLGLLHLLHAADCHPENLVMQDGQPFLIDAEMLCYPQVAGQEADDPLDVLRTGLLPRWAASDGGWADIGALQSGAHDWQEVIAGYTHISHFLDQHWATLIAADGLLRIFRRCEVRFAPRPTAAYLRLLDYLRQPACLRRGVDFSIEADRLAHTYLHAGERERFWPLLAEEHRAMARGDVPIFTVQAEQPNLHSGDRAITNALLWPDFSRPTAEGIADQRGLIAASLEHSAYLSRNSGPEPFLKHALRLGERLAERAVPQTDGTLGWYAVQFQPKSGLHQPGFVGDDLYAGRTGIALFLAGLHRVTGDDRWAALARAGLPPLPEFPDAPNFDFGGRLYGLSLAGHLLAAAELLAAARSLAVAAPAADAATGDRSHWGVLDGLAGRLLGVLALAQQTGAEDGRSPLLARAALWGDELLAAQEFWHHSSQALGGFSHGAAGIAYALTQLYQISGEARFLEGARRGWDFQRSLYDDPPGNWQDRRGQAPVYLPNWCNGAAGIGLAAAGCLSTLPDLADVVERSATLLLQPENSPFLDTLCCGGFGQIDCLLETGLRLGRQEWIDAAIAQAHQRLNQATAAGAFALYDDLPSDLWNPGFFRGVAGIGYTLLRLANAAGETDRSLSCVLALAV